MKLYVPEERSDVVRSLRRAYVSALARVEVPAALWAMQRARGLPVEWAQRLIRDFQAGLEGGGSGPRMISLAVSVGLLDHAARLAGSHALRGYDAVQLASALAAREADPRCDSFVCFDGALNTAASANGFALVP